MTQTGDKSYKCDTCGKTSTQSINLNIHMTPYTSENPYKCDLCGVIYKPLCKYTPNQSTGYDI